jgi:hypothetical protein
MVLDAVVQQRRSGDLGIARSFVFEFSLCEPVAIVGLDKDTAEPAVLPPAQAGAILNMIRAPSA